MEHAFYCLRSKAVSAQGDHTMCVCVADCFVLFCFVFLIVNVPDLPFVSAILYIKDISLSIFTFM